jgi:hypothetical protein
MPPEIAWKEAFEGAQSACLSLGLDAPTQINHSASAMHAI